MKTPPKKRGRPRGFDDAVVLDRATATFLTYGYAGASLEALTTAMDLNKPSLYAAFGDKRQLFQRVLQDLAGRRGQRYRDAFDRGETLEAAIREMLLEGVEIYLSDDVPPGCLLVTAAIGEALVDDDLARYAHEFFAVTDRVVATWVARHAPGAAPATTLAVSRMINGIIHDMALRARVGESRAKLREYARSSATLLARAAG
jgi:AcrR family transcriptional regulator